MIKLFRKRKDYIVKIIDENKVEEVEVKAVSKKEAISMVKDIITKSNIFGIDKNADLKCKKKNKGVIKRICSFFMKGDKNYE